MLGFQPNDVCIKSEQTTVHPTYMIKLFLDTYLASFVDTLKLFLLIKGKGKKKSMLYAFFNLFSHRQWFTATYARSL